MIKSQDYWGGDSCDRFLRYTTDFFQTYTDLHLDCNFLNSNTEIYIGGNEGELYSVNNLNDNINSAWQPTKIIMFSDDYGTTCRHICTIDSATVASTIFGWKSWYFTTDREPGVFYTITQEQYVVEDQRDFWDTHLNINYFRNYGDLITTYYYYLEIDFLTQKPPVTSLTATVENHIFYEVHLQWSEPEGIENIDAQVVRYKMFHNDELVDEYITTTEYVDYLETVGDEQYHVIAVYDDGTESKSYNIVYPHITTLATVSGIVTDSVTQNPIVGATVAFNTAYTAETDENGEYSLEIPVRTYYNIRFSAEHYADFVVPAFEVTEGENVLNAALSPKTAINEVESHFNIYPNPAKDLVTIEGENMKSVSVYNIVGQLIEKIETAHPTKAEINTTSYNSGVYIFRIATTDGNVTTKQVVISR